MVDQCPGLKPFMKLSIQQKRLTFKPLNSFYQVLSAEAKTKHGLNVHGVIFDELHAQTDRRLLDVMTQGSGDARRQPLTFIITTAGTSQHTVGWQEHQYADDVLRGKRVDPTYYPVIYAIKDGEDWKSEEVWRRVNPSLGITVGIDRVRDHFRRAKDDPAYENRFRQIRLNQWVSQTVRWMPLERWDQCAFPVDANALKGRECYAGLDLASTEDTTAFVLVFPPVGDEDKYQVLPFFWIPEDTLEVRVNREHIQYDEWWAHGYIKATEGNVVHYGTIEETIKSLAEKYKILEIAVDKWNATQMIQNLQEAKLNAIEFRQGLKSMSPACKELMRLVLSKKIAHGGHPVLRWQMDNINVRMDDAENIKPVKSGSVKRIDGAVATIMALDRAVRKEGRKKKSVYDTRGLLAYGANGWVK